MSDLPSDTILRLWGKIQDQLPDDTMPPDIEAAWEEADRSIVIVAKHLDDEWQAAKAAAEAKGEEP